MEKHIYDEKNGLSYTLCEDYYLPDLVLNEEKPTYGKYGMLQKQFLKEHRPIRYQNLLLFGKLTAHLNQIDQEVTEQVQFDARVQQGVESKRLYCSSWKNLYQIFGRKDLRNEG